MDKLRALGRQSGKDTSNLEELVRTRNDALYASCLSSGESGCASVFSGAAQRATGNESKVTAGGFLARSVEMRGADHKTVQTAQDIDDMGKKSPQESKPPTEPTVFQSIPVSYVSSNEDDGTETIPGYQINTGNALKGMVGNMIYSSPNEAIKAAFETMKAAFMATQGGNATLAQLFAAWTDDKNPTIYKVNRVIERIDPDTPGDKCTIQEDDGRETEVYCTDKIHGDSEKLLTLSIAEKWVISGWDDAYIKSLKYPTDAKKDKASTMEIGPNRDKLVEKLKEYKDKYSGVTTAHTYQVVYVPIPAGESINVGDTTIHWHRGMKLPMGGQPLNPNMDCNNWPTYVIIAKKFGINPIYPGEHVLSCMQADGHLGNAGNVDRVCEDKSEYGNESFPLTGDPDADIKQALDGYKNELLRKFQLDSELDSPQLIEKRDGGEFFTVLADKLQKMPLSKALALKPDDSAEEKLEKCKEAINLWKTELLTLNLDLFKKQLAKKEEALKAQKEEKKKKKQELQEKEKKLLAEKQNHSDLKTNIDAAIDKAISESKGMTSEEEFLRGGEEDEEKTPLESSLEYLQTTLPDQLTKMKEKIMACDQQNSALSLKLAAFNKLIENLKQQVASEVKQQITNLEVNRLRGGDVSAITKALGNAETVIKSAKDKITDVRKDVENLKKTATQRDEEHTKATKAAEDKFQSETAAAAKTHKEAIVTLEAQWQAKADKAQKDINECKRTHGEALEKASAEHAAKLEEKVKKNFDSTKELKAEHRKAIDALTTKNNTEIKAAKEEHTAKIAELTKQAAEAEEAAATATDNEQREHTEELEKLRIDTAKQIKDTNAEHEKAIKQAQKTFQGEMTVATQKHEKVMNALQQQISTLKTEIRNTSNAAVTENAIINNAIQTLAEKTRELENILEVGGIILKTASTKLRGGGPIADAIEKATTVLTGILTKVQQLGAAKETALAALVTANEKMQKDNQECADKTKQCATKNEQCKSQINEQNTKILNLQREKSEYTAENKNCESQIIEQNAKILDLEKAKKELEATMEKTQQALAKWAGDEDRVNKFTQQLKEVDAKVQALGGGGPKKKISGGDKTYVDLIAQWNEAFKLLSLVNAELEKCSDPLPKLKLKYERAVDTFNAVQSKELPTESSMQRMNALIKRMEHELIKIEGGAGSVDELIAKLAKFKSMESEARAAKGFNKNAQTIEHPDIDAMVNALKLHTTRPTQQTFVKNIDTTWITDDEKIKGLTVEIDKIQQAQRTFGKNTDNKTFREKYQKEVDTFLMKVEEFTSSVRVYVRVTKPPGVSASPDQTNEDFRNSWVIKPVNEEEQNVVAPDDVDGSGGGDWSRDQYIQTKEGKKLGPFNRVFGPTKDNNSISTSNKVIYDEMKGILDGVFDGKDVIMFGYGASGSGKTYTLLGDTDTDDTTKYGILQQFLANISSEYKVSICVKELYGITSSFDPEMSSALMGAAIYEYCPESYKHTHEMPKTGTLEVKDPYTSARQKTFQGSGQKKKAWFFDIVENQSKIKEDEPWTVVSTSCPRVLKDLEPHQATRNKTLLEFAMALDEFKFCDLKGELKGGGNSYVGDFQRIYKQVSQLRSGRALVVRASQDDSGYPQLMYLGKNGTEIHCGHLVQNNDIQISERELLKLWAQLQESHGEDIGLCLSNLYEAKIFGQEEAEQTKQKTDVLEKIASILKPQKDEQENFIFTVDSRGDEGFMLATRSCRDPAKCKKPCVGTINDTEKRSKTADCRTEKCNACNEPSGIVEGDRIILPRVFQRVGATKMSVTYPLSRKTTTTLSVPAAPQLRGFERVKATPNNPESSRGNLFITLRIEGKGKLGFLTVADFPGVEDPTSIADTFNPEFRNQTTLQDILYHPPMSNYRFKGTFVDDRKPFHSQGWHDQWTDRTEQKIQCDYSGCKSRVHYVLRDIDHSFSPDKFTTIREGEYINTMLKHLPRFIAKQSGVSSSWSSVHDTADREEDGGMKWLTNPSFYWHKHIKIISRQPHENQTLNVSQVDSAGWNIHEKQTHAAVQRRLEDGSKLTGYDTVLKKQKQFYRGMFFSDPNAWLQILINQQSNKSNTVASVGEDFKNHIDRVACDRALFEMKRARAWYKWHAEGMDGEEPTRQNVLLIDVLQSIAKRKCAGDQCTKSNKDPKLIAFNLLRTDDDNTSLGPDDDNTSQLGPRGRATCDSVKYANSLRPDYMRTLKSSTELKPGSGEYRFSSGVYDKTLSVDKKDCKAIGLPIIAAPEKTPALLAFLLQDRPILWDCIPIGASVLTGRETLPDCEVSINTSNTGTIQWQTVYKMQIFMKYENLSKSISAGPLKLNEIAWAEKSFFHLGYYQVGNASCRLLSNAPKIDRLIGELSLFVKTVTENKRNGVNREGVAMLKKWNSLRTKWADAALKEKQPDTLLSAYDGDTNALQILYDTMGPPIKKPDNLKGFEEEFNRLKLLIWPT